MIVFERNLGGSAEPPLVIIHGLLGSGKNWLTAGNALTAARKVFVLDLPNHGDASHTEEMNYPFMRDGLLEWMNSHNLERILLMGHSMGGKLGMRLACDCPSRLERLIVVDIAPRTNPNSHAAEFDAMMKLDLAKLTSRRDAEAQLEELGVRSWGMRQFLLTNLERGSSGTFHWRVNLPVLAASIGTLALNPLGDDDRFDGPTLFVRCTKSDFIHDENIPTIRRHFPNVTIESLDSGHNPHIEAREAFVDVVSKSLSAAAD